MELTAQEIATLRRVKRGRTVEGSQPERFRIAVLIANEYAHYNRRTKAVTITQKGDRELEFEDKCNMR